MDDKGSKYYFSRLSDEEKDIYNQICRSLLRFDSILSIKCISSTNVHRILNAVLFDNPVFFYLNSNGIMITRSPLGLELRFRYDYTPNEADVIWQKAQSKIDSFVTRIKPNMKPLAKQIEAHRWMQQNIKIAAKPYDKTCFSLVGALVNGKCVCEGFAHAYKLICDRLHLASIIVTGIGHLPDGSSELHAWNITRIDGITSHIDVTWDAIYGLGSYDYFNLTDDEISVDHEFDRSVYPKCNKDALGYFRINKLIAHNKSELTDLIRTNAHKDFFSVKLEFPCEREYFARCGFPKGEIRYNDSRKIIFYKKSSI